MPSTIATDDHARQFAALFLAHQPQAKALMQSEATHTATGRKYEQFRVAASEADILAHLAGKQTIAIPYAHGGLGRILPLDIDAGGIAVAEALLREAGQRGLWAFGTYDEQRGTAYVILPFDELAAAERLQILGRELALAAAAQVAQGEARIENGRVVADGPGGQRKNRDSRARIRNPLATWAAPLDGALRPPAIAGRRPSWH